MLREPLEWHYHASDLRQLKDIDRQFGTRALATFPTADIFKYKLYYRFVKAVRVVKPLNYVPYIKEEAMTTLVEPFGGSAPRTSTTSRTSRDSTKAIGCRGSWATTKRRAHFASLILTKQMTRDEALRGIAQPAYDEDTIDHDFEYVAMKLDLTVDELRALMAGPNKSYGDCRNSMPFINAATTVLRLSGAQRAIIR
jgi:hypothetical protein